MSKIREVITPEQFHDRIVFEEPAAPVQEDDARRQARRIAIICRVVFSAVFFIAGVLLAVQFAGERNVWELVFLVLALGFSGYLLGTAVSYIGRDMLTEERLENSTERIAGFREHFSAGDILRVDLKKGRLEYWIVEDHVCVPEKVWYDEKEYRDDIAYAKVIVRGERVVMQEPFDGTERE